MTRHLAVVIAVGLLVPGVAGARPRVAVVAFDGDSSGAVQETVANVLDGDYKVTGPDEVGRTLEKLGLDTEMSDKQLKKLANELEADAIVRGELSKSNGHKLLHVRLFVNGKRVRGFKVEFGSVKSEKFKQALKDKMDEKLSGEDKPKKKKGEEEEVAEKPDKKKGKKKGEEEEVAEKPDKKKGKKGSTSGDEATDEEDPLATGKKGKKTGKKGAEEEVAEKPDKKKGKKGAEEEEVAEKPDKKKGKKGAADEELAADKKKGKKGEEETKGGDEESAGDAEKPEGADAKGKKRTASIDGDAETDAAVSTTATVTPASSGPRSANRDAVRFNLGMSFTGRSLTFNSRPFEQAPKPYSNSPVPGYRLGGEVYPLAFMTPDSILAGIGIAGYYDKTAKLNLQSTAQMGTLFPVEEKAWSIGARFRFVFGSKPTSPSATLGAGIFRRSFKVDRTQLMEGNVIDLPDVAYQGYDPGLEFRVPLIKQVAFVLGGQALLVSGAGQIQQGYSYGKAKVTAGGAMAGVDIVLKEHYALRIVAEAAQFGFAFVGTGELTNSRDHDPTTPDVGGASDRYIGGAVSLGALY